jgi:hypothetical protein
MLLAHPFDHQDHQADRERIMVENRGADVFGRPDHLALDGKAADERFVEALEQLDVLRFLAGEVEDRANAPVVAEQVRPRMVDDERQNELFDDDEDTKLLMRADLVEDELL